MNKIVLSALAALTLSSVAVNANEIKLYQDANGQVFTQPAPDRTLLDTNSLGNTKQNITIVDKKSPNFLLGKQTHINMKFVAQDNPDMWLKAGVRIQGTFENRSVEDLATGATTSYYDAYLRRVRFEVAAGFNKYASFTMDVRNDKANYKDKGEQSFNVGDAYVKIKKPFGSSLVNFKLFRAKIDVSRTETVKSARVLHFDRPHVADEAAQYITHNRRGTNAQVYGNWNKKVHYQVAIGDGVYSGKLHDASGATFGGSNFMQKNFFYGGKIVLSPFDGWEEKKRTESYFGQGKHFEVGAGYWVSPDIQYTTTGGVNTSVDHKLLNLEMSAHYKGAFVQAEYFDFDGVAKDWASTTRGKSNGWYATGEYVFADYGFVAPFVRYESWDKFKDLDGYDLTSKIAGVNWYLMGNSIKAGLTFQEDKYGANIGNEKERRIKVTSQWFF
ncbi:OprO/OprP family phosphate-selective porin [Sulfurimonas sp. NW7]|uniref:hypothetical protein n=1 Tax=Sulfurimonas sp. NW7 TaxID=2922727 RepID=UPI003DA83AE4